MASRELEAAEPELALLDMPDLVLEATASLLPPQDRLRLLSCCRRLHQLGRTSPKVWDSGLWVLVNTLAGAVSFLSWLQPRRHLLSSLELHTEPPAHRRARERAAALKLTGGSGNALSAARGGGRGGRSSSSSSSRSSSSDWDSEDSDELTSEEEDEEYDSEPDEDGVEYWLLGALAGSQLTTLRCGFKCACISLGGLLATLPRLRELHLTAFDVTVIPAFAAALPQLCKLSLVAVAGQDGEVALSPGCLPAGLTALTIHGMGAGVLRDIIAPAGLSRLQELRLSEPSRWSDEGGSSEEEESEDEEGGDGFEVSHCRLVTEGLDSLTSLTSLSLRSARLKAVPPQITALTGLRSLDLGSNFKFTGLGLGFGAPHQLGLELLETLPLTKLDLQNNNLQELPALVWRELKVLNLFSNSGLLPRTVVPPLSSCPLEVLSIHLSVAIRFAIFLAQLPQLRCLHLGGLSLADGGGVATLLAGLRSAPKLQLVTGSSQLEQIATAAVKTEAPRLLKELRERGVRFDPESREHLHLH